jgi:Flp pilus assembly protein TadB
MMSTSIVVLVLAVGWCAYLAMWWKDSRKSVGARSDRIDAFSAGMGSLGGSASRSAQGLRLHPLELKPQSSTAAAQRRRQVTTVLSGLAVVTLLASFVLGVVAIIAHVLFDVALVAFGWAAIQRRNRAAEREIKVQMLYPEDVTPLHAPRHSVNA